jgi:DNA-directed RNA polymerase specialized sigma24 family protein
MLNISLDTAKKRLARGREKFRDAYERLERR